MPEGTHDLLVGIDSLAQTSVQTPPFPAAGEQWHLVVKSKAREGGPFLAVYLEIAGAFVQRRPDVAYKLTLVNYLDPSKNITKAYEKTFDRALPTSYITLLTMATLQAPNSGFVGGIQQHICLRIKIVTKEEAKGSWEPPPAQSLLGEMALGLEDGSNLAAHRTYLEHASTVFSQALACSAPAEASCGAGASGADAGEVTVLEELPPSKRHRSMLKLPLPGTRRKQALLLLHCLYAFDRKSWAESLQPHELADLATIAHRFACTAVLGLADSSLVAACKREDLALSGVREAPAQLQLARDLNLVQLEMHVAYTMGKNAHRLDLTAVDAFTAAMLKGACELYKSA